MKKFFALVSILICSLLCTACINNFAIQELNQMGIDYMQKGDYDNAISRLQSSVDLDENVFETRFNLGVAYTKKDEYKKAIEQFEAAINLNPKSYEANYSYAVALESLGFEFEERMFDNQSDDKTKVKALSKEDIENLWNMLNQL